MGIDQYLFLLDSLKWTVILSAVAFACGIPCGLGVALFYSEWLSAGGR